MSWRAELSWNIVLTPMLIFSVYFILRVAPGFLMGIYEDKRVDDMYSLLLPIAYFSFMVGYFSLRKYDIVSLMRQYNENVTPSKTVVIVLSFLLTALGLLMYQGIPPSIESAFGVATNSLSAQEAATLVSDARREISKGHVFNQNSNSNGMIREIIYIIASLQMYMAMLLFLKESNKSNILLLLISILLSYIFVSGDGTRGRFVVTIIGLIAVYSYHRKIKIKTTLYIFFLIMALSIFLGLYTNKMSGYLESGDYMAMLSSVLERVLVGNSINDVYAISAFDSGYFGKPIGYWLLRDIAAFIPGVSLDKPLAYYLYLYEIGGDSTTYLTGTSISRGYADGGVLFLVLYFYICGAFCGAYGYIIKLIFKLGSNNFVSSGFIYVILVGFGQAYVSGISGLIFTIGIGFSLFLCVRSFLGVNYAFNK